MGSPFSDVLTVLGYPERTGSARRVLIGIVLAWRAATTVRCASPGPSLSKPAGRGAWRAAHRGRRKRRRVRPVIAAFHSLRNRLNRRALVPWGGHARRMSMSLLLVRTERGVTGGAPKSSCGITARTRKAHASSLGRALRSVLLGVSAVGVTFVAAALWAVASVLLDMG